MKHFAAFGHKEFVLALGYKGYVIKEFFLQYKLLSASLTVDLVSGHEPSRTTATRATTGRSISSRPASRPAPAAGCTGLRRWLNDEPFMLTYGDGVSDVDLAAVAATHRRCGKIATDHRGASAVALRRPDVRERRRHRLRREAADWRRLDQRRLHDVRARRLRLHGRPDRQPRERRARAACRRSAAGACTRTAGSGSAWTRCASVICSRSCGSADGPRGSDGNSHTSRAHALPVVRHRRHQGNSFARLAAAAQRLSGGWRAG